MFGTVRPRPCALPSSDRQAWRNLYCGTCKGLHAYGTPARALTSWDAVLLGALIEGLQADAGPCGTCRCPLNPMMHRSIVAPESVATRTSAAVQVLLADAWLADRAEDELAAAGWLRAWVPSERAAEALATLGIDPTPFGKLTAAQAAVEAEASAAPEEAARPTAELLRHLFRALVDLPGTAPALQTASARRTLGRLGEDLGRAIYLVDALEDLAKDTRSGAFNSCLLDGRPDPARTEAAARALEGAVDRLAEGVRGFPWTRNEALLVHGIAEQLPERARAAARAGRSAAASAALARWTALPWWARAWERLSSWVSGIRWLATTPEEEEAGAEKARRRQRRESWCGDNHWCCLDACMCCDCCVDCGPGDSGCIDACPCEAACCCEC